MIDRMQNSEYMPLICKEIFNQIDDPLAYKPIGHVLRFMKEQYRSAEALRSIFSQLRKSLQKEKRNCQINWNGKWEKGTETTQRGNSFSLLNTSLSPSKLEVLAKASKSPFKEEFKISPMKSISSFAIKDQSENHSFSFGRPGTDDVWMSKEGTPKLTPESAKVFSA